MDTEENKAKELLIVAEAINKGNLAVLDECLTPDFIYRGPSGEVKGIKSYKQFIANLRTAYPDIHVDVKDIVAEGDMVATRTLCTFTFIGQADAIPPKGKKVSMSSTIIDRFKDGKLAETWEYYDRLELNRQLGVILSNGYRSEDTALPLIINALSLVAQSLSSRLQYIKLLKEDL
ncbi:MAG: ester cyclase [Dehalococcoidales bacterium]